MLDVGAMRALGFCVSVGHAEYMAARFNTAGIPALAVSGGTPRDERTAALRALREREVNVLFAVDLFNEGLDIPDVDTLLLLRPTQSATVFLQQLGRGLRRTPDKPVLTVLDFIGQQRREFRFDLKYRALTGVSRTALVRQLENGFAYLPSGCELVLDEVAQRTVLDNVRQQLNLTRRDLVAEVRTHGDMDLAAWLRESGRDLGDVYRNGGSWTALRRAAGLMTPPAGASDTEDQLLRRVAALVHVDDPERAEAYRQLLSESVRYDDLPDRLQRYARMLFFSLWSNGGGHNSYQDGYDVLSAQPAVGAELQEVIALGLANAEHISLPLEPGMEDIPLWTHASYSREEVLAALDWASLSRKPSSYVAGLTKSEAARTHVFTTTLAKSERDFKPSNMYVAQALSSTLMTWETPNSTSVDTRIGRELTTHRELGEHVLLMGRQQKQSAVGLLAAYTCYGPATYAGHAGDRPMTISWRLVQPLPTSIFRAAAVGA